MRALSLLVLGLCALVGCATVRHLPAGQAAPDFALPTPDGEMVRLRDLRGKVVVLNFWAAWCPPCRRSLPYLESLQLTSGQGVVVVGVNNEPREDMLEALKQRPVSYVVLHDGERRVSERYQVEAIPTTYVIDRDGIVRHVERGLGAEARARLEAAIEAARGR